jgi:hypothetical protein
VNPDNLAAMTLRQPAPNVAHVVDMGRFLAIRALLRGITDPTRIHAVNTPLLVEVPSAAVE